MTLNYNKVSLGTLDEFNSFFKNNPNIKYVDAILSDLSGIIRGKRLPINEAEKLFKSGIQFCYSTFLLDVTGYCPDAAGRGFSDGDPDATYYPVAGTLKKMPWHKDSLAQVLITIQDESRYSSIVDPRNVLAKVLEKFDDLKLSFKIAFELEFYLFNKRKSILEKPISAISNETNRKSEGTQVYGMRELDEFYEFLEDVNKFCKIQNIPATTASSEFAPAQFEINLKHTDEALKAADDASLLRRVIKETAIKHDYEASFLSKPFVNETGSGMHVHLSIFDQDNKNIFASKNEEGSEQLRFAIGGLQKTTYDNFLIFAPNVNSYRRFEPDQFVPVNNSWGPNNRSVAFRIPRSDNNAKRIEHRVAGAEANSYLVLAAILSGIHLGLINKLEPSKFRIDNACADADPEMPKTIEMSIGLFENSEFCKSYYSEEYVNMYSDLKRKELKSFYSEISDIEYKWYLNL
ncbi:MAG: Gamma-glutamylputrescine synthetase PuuA [Alphaproteobacteria bacterium MarineAlpha5_Bin5]|nr:MAG: Gamma-glutamylputrescine synthetase PuuA [Alphaproteobacteria bacterium MarineAlpha5_Bin5]PPR52374.1 MAG: Gamma-glutamylputrescine synthetase PuuA [Alphaproteobacteria bacterium MarineAlpha5_Bin4]|tara:strand:- start:4436 stop:5821 length:1386 start_codon:yes stop_codon:yes gene_type:complete